MNVLQIENVRDVGQLSGWKLIELQLDKNPLCLRYDSKARYIR